MSDIQALITEITNYQNDGKDVSAQCKLLAKRIDEAASIDEMYRIESQSLINVLKMAGPLKLPTGKIVVQKLKEVFESYALYYFPFIDFGEIGSKIVDIINPFSDVPVFREVMRAIVESKQDNDDEAGNTEITVDWELEYKKRDQENLQLKSKLEQAQNQKNVNHEIIKKLMEANKVQPMKLEEAAKLYVGKKYKDAIKGPLKGVKAKSKDLLFAGLGKAIEARDAEAVKAITAYCNFDDFKAAFSLVHPKQGPKLLDEKLAICCCIMCSEIGPSYKDENGNTPLHLCCKIDNVPAVEIFIALGADINALNKSSNTPLHVAIQSGSSEAVRVLMLNGATLESGAALGKNLLHMAARGGNSEVIRKILNSGKWSVSAVDSYGKTPLHYAAESGSSLAVRTLISCGADPVAKDFYGCEPILYAARADASESIQALINAGASPNAADPNGSTALHYAAMGKGVNAVKTLVEKGANLSARDKFDDTPLHEACYRDQSEAVKALVTAGADIAAEGNEGKLPIHEAAYWGNLKALLILINLKANIKAQTKDGDNVLHFAAARGEKVTVERLMMLSGGSLNVPNKNGIKPSDIAKTPEIALLITGKK